MLEQQGRVIAVSGDFASIRLGGSRGCSACAAGKGCGAGIFARLFQRKAATLNLVNRLDVRAGQVVIVGLPESSFLFLVFRLYLFPLLAGLAGMTLGHYISAELDAQPILSDFASLFGGVAAGAVAILWNRKAEMEFPRNSDVHLLQVLGQKESDQCGAQELPSKN